MVIHEYPVDFGLHTLWQCKNWHHLAVLLTARHMQSLVQIYGQFMLNILRIKQFMFHSAIAQNGHKFIWDCKIKNDFFAL